MWYAAKASTYGRIFRGRGGHSAVQADEPRRIFLRRGEPIVSTEVRREDERPSYGAVEFASRAEALEAARLIAGAGRRVAVPVAPCPNDGTSLDWIEDNYHCRRCGDEWSHEQIRGYPIPT